MDLSSPQGQLDIAAAERHLDQAAKAVRTRVTSGKGLDAALVEREQAPARLLDKRIARLLKPLTRQGYTDAVGTEVRGRVRVRGPRE